jgi:hypothetical protein
LMWNLEGFEERREDYEIELIMPTEVFFMKWKLKGSKLRLWKSAEWVNFLSASNQWNEFSRETAAVAGS